VRLQNFSNIFVICKSIRVIFITWVSDGDTKIKASVSTRPVLWEYFIRIRKSHIYCEYRHFDLTPHSTV